MKDELEDIQRKMRSEPEKMAEYEERVAALNLRYPLEPEVYGFTASMDYCNDSANEIIHRAELTRATKEELYSAMREYAEVITDARQRRVYEKMLAEHLGR